LATVVGNPYCKHIDVAVAVIKREDGKVLFAERPAGKACAGEWEFPGGKVEPNETPRQALDREIKEELAINITEARPWLTLSHNYPHACVLLHFFIVSCWTGQEHAQEGQKLSWQNLSNLTISPLLAANGPIIKALLLPDIYAISAADEMGVEKFLLRLPIAIKNGLKILQIRETSMTACQLKQFVDRVLPITAPANVTTLINSAMPREQQKRFSGLHLTSHHLMQLVQRPDFECVGASCHNRHELERAIQLKLDFAVLSPVNRTLSHPEAIPLGLSKMRKIISNSAIPVYALGGMNLKKRVEIQSYGAHGIAMVRNAWQ